MNSWDVVFFLGLAGVFSYILKDLIRNFFCGIVIKYHPEIQRGDWIKAGRFGPKAKIKNFGVKYSYCVTEEGKEIMYENQTIYTAPWIEKGDEEKSK